MVVSYWEMVASFLTSGVLNEELFFQSGFELLMVWERVREITPLIREKRKSPGAWKNLEAVAGRMAENLEKSNPGAHEAFRTNIMSLVR
jgi:hypothetical protein